ncbi:Transmembrane protein 138 [Liparis tanakae]|uniref:Transmembrane protein 138 n=1 Tax=Liparis tanakae TaxID=230148 RepID=A0A4Z2EKV2_9TELE|nr:Transmembrane protein 138 [Liparis tanakae]
MFLRSASLDPAWNRHSPPGRPAFGPETLQTSNYSLVLLIQIGLLAFDLFVNSFSELLRDEQAAQLVLFIIQDIGILFNLIIILLMLFNTYVFQIGLVAVLLERFRAALMLCALYLTFSIILHSWLMVGPDRGRENPRLKCYSNEMRAHGFNCGRYIVSEVRGQLKSRGEGGGRVCIWRMQSWEEEAELFVK